MDKELRKLLVNRLGLTLTILMVSVAAFAGGTDYRQRAHTQLNDGNFNEDDVKAEIRFGRPIAARILGRLPLLQHRGINGYVQLVGKALARNSSRPELDFYFAVVDSPAINAFSTPGGYVFVTTGLLKVIRDEAELAAVLAHEIAHVTERHIVKELNIRSKDNSTSAGLARLVGGASDTVRTAFMQSIDKAVAILFEKGFKVADEHQADQVGMMIMANTGYNPTSLVSLMIRIQSQMRGQQQKSQVNHPPTRARIEAMMRFMQNNGLTNTRLPKLKKRYQRNVRL